MAATRRAPWPVGHVEGEVGPVEATAAKAALKMAGDSEWRIGEPITAASRVDPVITRQPQPSRRRRSAALASTNSL